MSLLSATAFLMLWAGISSILLIVAACGLAIFAPTSRYRDVANAGLFLMIASAVFWLVSFLLQ